MDRIPGNVRRRQAFAGPPELARFFRGERLTAMPKRAEDRTAVLSYIATLRRYLVDAGLLTRASGIYWGT